MAYTPRFRKQGDGTRCQWSNCMICSTAMAVDRHLRGANPAGDALWLPSVGQVRNRLTPHSCGGTSFEQNAGWAKSMYGASLDIRYDLPWDDFKTLIRSGRGAVVLTKYSELRGSKFDACPTFYGNHGIYVNAFRRNLLGRWEVQVGDPLADGRYLWSTKRYAPNGFKWWPAPLLREAVGAYAGTYEVHAMLTKDTE